MNEKQPQLPDDRADVEQEEAVAKPSFTMGPDNPLFLSMLDDCASALLHHWEPPEDEELDAAINARQCEGYVSSAHLLGHWLMRHPLYRVICRLPVFYTPKPREVLNELKTLAKELDQQLAAAILVADSHAKEMSPAEKEMAEAKLNELHEIIMLVKTSTVDDVLTLRELAVMTAVDPFRAYHDMMPAEGQPLN